MQMFIMFTVCDKNSWSVQQDIVEDIPIERVQFLLIHIIGVGNKALSMQDTQSIKKLSIDP